MTETLHVIHAAERVGGLRVDAEGSISFRYDEAWLDSGFAISLSLPLAERAYGTEAHRFFANLLPEGAVRIHVARRLGISADNDWELLRALGGDCAGALALVPDPSDPRAADYEELPLARLREIARAPRPGLATLGGAGEVRLSLAGAQDKLPVRISPEGSLQLPRGTAASTHIIKFANPDLAHLPANEVFVTRLAGKLGLPAAVASLDTRLDPPLCVTQRYDRRIGEEGVVRRIHQEDFCQALGLPPSRKYQREGGPGLAAIHALLEAHSPDPAGDTRDLLRWTIFGVLVGNSDGHAKNLSLLYEGSVPSLAPFYDLVSTRPYRQVTRRLAMSIGGEDDPGQLGASHWSGLAEDVGLRPAFMVDMVAETLEALPDALEETAEELRGEHGDLPVLQMMVPQIRRQVRRTRHLLER